jgi:serpin B
MDMNAIVAGRKLVRALLMLSSLLGALTASNASPGSAIAEGGTAFAFDLYGQLKSTPGNLFLSPYSISTALAMTYAGARGNTEKQMAHVLHFPGDQNRVHSGLAEVQRQLGEAGKDIELNRANALWAQKGHPFLPAFLGIATGSYKASVKQVDFRSEAEVARKEVNGWVAHQTKDRIQNILPEHSLDDLSRLVLVNAIYFKGAWSVPFDKGATSTQPFALATGTRVKVPLMHQMDQVKYMEDDDLQAVELPYGKGELSMVILLPRDADGCTHLESKLSPASLSRALGKMSKQKVEIFLPRFKLESEFDLGKNLQNMGMKDAFDDKADFSGIDGTKMLYISHVFHKAWGEVNEEGTEAAAATAVTMQLKGIVKNPPPPPPVFRADHPFIFFIRDTRSGLLLFMGRLSQPSV